MPWWACRWCGEVARFDDDGDTPMRCPHCYRKAGWEPVVTCHCPVDADGDLVPQPGCELHWRQVMRADPPPPEQHP